MSPVAGDIFETTFVRLFDDKVGRTRAQGGRRRPPGAPFKPRICAALTVRREESDYGTPGAWFLSILSAKFKVLVLQIFSISLENGWFSYS